MQPVVEFVIRATCAEWLVVGTAVASYALAARLLPRVPATVRWLGAVLAGIWLATVGFHVLAAAGWFTLPAALIGVTALVALLVPTTRGLGRTFARDARALRRLAARFRRSPHRGIATALFVCAAPVLLRPLFMPLVDWDTVTYHALKAGMWVQHAGRLQMDAPGPWAIYGERWGGSELLMAWAMLPFHSDLLAVAGEGLEWLGVGFAVMLLARQLGAREPYASSAGGFMMAVPTMRLLVGAGYTEPVLCLCFAAALIFAIRCLRRPSLGTFVFAVVACALCAGIKMTSISTAGVIGGLLVLRILVARRGWLQRFGWVALASVAASAVLVPWMVHTYRKTGFPLSPLPVVVAGHTLGVAAPETEWYMKRPDVGDGDWETERAALMEVVFGWRDSDKETLHAPAMLPVAVALIGLLFLARRAPGSALFMLAALGLTIASYYDPRLAVVRHYWTISSSRFLLPALVVAVPLSVAWCREVPGPGRLYLRLLWLVTASFLLQMTTVGVSSSGVEAATLVAGGVLLLLSVLGWLVPQTPSAARVPLVALALSGALLMLHGLRADFRGDLMEFDFSLHDLPRYWVNGALLLDDPARPRRIAVTSGPAQTVDNWFAASFLGSALQNEVLYVSPMADGSVPHFGLGDLNSRIVRDADATAWMARLNAQGITHVVSFAPTSVELDWMRAQPNRFHRLDGGDDWGVFELRP